MARTGFVFRFLKPCAVVACIGLLAACGGGGGGGGEPVLTVTTVTVTSPTTTPRQGDTVQLTAVARDQFGAVVLGTTATWSSSASAVATVSGTGRVQALAGGSAILTATINGVTGTLDLTITPRVTTTVTVKGNLKIGQFTLAFTDLEIPLTGLPISVQRTYDSRDTSRGDFGHGWWLDLSTTELQESETAYVGWQTQVSPGRSRRCAWWTRLRTS